MSSYTLLTTSSCLHCNSFFPSRITSFPVFAISIPIARGFLRFDSRTPLLSLRRRRPVTSSASSLDLPLLPFDMSEVLVPTETKTLHLYEARYLALLDESLAREKLFVHFVLDPIVVDDSSNEASFAARYACVVFIENIERLEVGALVSIRGVGRVKIAKFDQASDKDEIKRKAKNLNAAEPYLRGTVMPVKDRLPGSDNTSALNTKVMEVKEALHILNSLEIKLKAPKEALLQTYIANSLMWAEKEPLSNIDEAFIPSLAERISFAAFQPISGSTEPELLRLQLKKIKAMDIRDTTQRLDESQRLIQENISTVAAKLAIQSVGMQ